MSRGPPHGRHRSSHLRCRSQVASPARHLHTTNRHLPGDAGVLNRMMLKVAISAPMRSASSGGLGRHWRRSIAPSPSSRAMPWPTTAGASRSPACSDLTRPSPPSTRRWSRWKPDYAEAYNNRRPGTARSQSSRHGVVELRPRHRAAPWRRANAQEPRRPAGGPQALRGRS